MPSPVAVVEVVRSGFVEGRHHGSVVALDARGRVDWSLGDVGSAILPRSCNKPLQVLGMLRAGLKLDGELLALACASHSGESFHLRGVREILAGAGLDEAALQTPPDYPLDDAERESWIRAGGVREPVAMNCSGKHAAMLATCVANGWDVATYLHPDHPLQQAILDTFAEATGEPVETVAVDGCGAPLLSTSLTGLARAFRSLATAHEGPEKAVADAIRAHPTWVSGTRRDEARLLAAVSGAIAKAGAEGCYAVALEDGTAFALKIEDGAARARPVAMAAVLERVAGEHLSAEQLEEIRSTGRQELLGGGRPVGVLRPTF
jgi:L-asparaginase II